MTAEPSVSARDRLLSIAVLVAAVALAWWFLFGRGPGEPSAPSRQTADSYVAEYGGSLTAIEAILGYSDCDILARTFDDAKANFDSFGAGTDRGREQAGRMAAADDRMDALNCP